MRVIVRFSLDGDGGTRLRNRLGGVLAQYGFVRGTNTATWEAQHIGRDDIRTAMTEFWATIADYNGPGRLDHFWMYSDRTDLDEIDPHAEPDDDD